MPKDLYQLLFMVDGQGLWTFFAESQQEAEQRGKRMVEAERKKGINASMLIVPQKDVVESIHNAVAGKGFNLVRKDI
jgi:hypothetical protein